VGRAPSPAAFDFVSGKAEMCAAFHSAFWHNSGMYAAFDFASAQAIQRLTLKPHAFFAEPITAPDHG
jgi:hypothetical protein